MRLDTLEPFGEILTMTLEDRKGKLDGSLCSGSARFS